MSGSATSDLLPGTAMSLAAEAPKVTRQSYCTVVVWTGQDGDGVMDRLVPVPCRVASFDGRCILPLRSLVASIRVQRHAKILLMKHGRARVGW